MKEIIQKMVEAEKEALRLIDNSEAEGRKVAEKAQAEAISLVEQARKEARKVSREIIETAHAEVENNRRAKLEAIREHRPSLDTLDDARVREAVDVVIKALAGGPGDSPQAEG